MITGKDFINSYYEENEKLFSTGDSELDDILEEVYYSGIEGGYEYAQKEFASKRKMAKQGKMMLKKTAKAVETGELPNLNEFINRKAFRHSNRLPKTASGERGLRQVQKNALNHTKKLFPELNTPEMTAALETAAAREKEKIVAINKAGGFKAAIRKGYEF